MSRHEHHSDSTGSAGMGIVARFTWALALVSGLFAAGMSYGLMRGVDSFSNEAVEAARKEMASTSARVEASELAAEFSGPVKTYRAGNNILSVGDMPVETQTGVETLRLYQVKSQPVAATDSPERTLINLYTRKDSRSNASDQMLLLVVLAASALVLAIVMIGSYTAKRLVDPLRSMIEDILAISRGHYRSVRAPGAVGEIALLSRAVNRMVDGLVEGQETQTQLEEREREGDVLRELRRNLQPMTVVPPEGYGIETLLVQADGAGSSDFVDAISDEQNRPSLVVGAGATSGMAGSLLMALTRAYLRSAVLGGACPIEACDNANRSLNRDLARGLYSAAMVARLEPSTGAIELVSAGHQVPAVRWAAAEGELRKLQPNGIALGFDDGPVFRKSLELLKLDLLPGDALFMCSTSVFEASSPSGKTLGESGVYQLAKIGINNGLGAMEEKLRAFLGGEPDADLAFALVRRESHSS
jgi:HAMP domain-containing protein